MPPAAQSVGSTGSGERWGPLWGARAADWALSEDRQTPTYEAALERVELKPGQLVLDIGCGVGAFLRLITERYAWAYGLDASEALLEVARARLPEADLRVGEMEALPYEDDTFDLVTPAGLAVLVGAEREPEFKQALVAGLAPHRTPDGGYRLSNEYHYLIARA